MHFAKGKNPGPKGYTLNTSIHVTSWKSLERQNYRDRKQVSCCQGTEEECGGTTDQIKKENTQGNF